MKRDIFDLKEEKDLTVSAHWTIKQSIVNEVKKIAKEKKMSDSKVVNTILENFIYIDIIFINLILLIK